MILRADDLYHVMTLLNSLADRPICFHVLAVGVQYESTMEEP